MKTCRRYFIRGRVQGVCFRASTRRQAKRLNLTGYAGNLRDGRVEVVACGELKAVEALEVWLHQGSDLAEVMEVVSEVFSGQEFLDFSIG